jgi:sn-glycerol 3-phosphate transport system permease protein
MSREIYGTNWQAYLLLAPLVGLSLVFAYYPAVDTFRLSLYETRAFGLERAFIGLDNFTQLLASGSFQYSLFISLVFAVVVVTTTLVVSLYIGFLVYRVLRGSSLYLIAAIWPYALPLAVSALLLSFLFHPTVGVVTSVLNSAGVSFQWRNDPVSAFAIVALATTWKLVGYNVIFVVGALATVPDSLEETARLDDIGTFRQIRRVYLPLISPTIAFLIVLNTVEALFRPFAVVDLMTSGGPGQATNLLIYKIYQDAFAYRNLGVAAAESIILFVISGALMYAQIRVSDDYAHFG